MRTMVRAVALAAILFVLGSAPAYATYTCTLSSTGISFGMFTGSQVAISGTINMHCTGSGTSNFNVKLSTGSGSFAARVMKNGTNTLSYNLYMDSAHSQILGDGTGSTVFFSGKITASPSDFTLTMFGLIPAQALPVSGSYMDTVVATLTCTSGGTCTTTTNVPITAAVQPVCTISATNLNFGAYSLAQLDGQSQIQLSCASGASWNVGLNAGTDAGATVSTRRMTGPSPFKLGYSLFSNAGRTVNWGNTVGTDTVSGTGTGTTQSLNVFGRIPASQTVGPGSYRDTIVVTITF